MGKRMAARKVRPSLIIASSAARARATAKFIAEALKYPPEFLQIEKELYLASADTILELACGQKDNFSDLLIIGHNPGMTDLVNQLLPSIGLNNLPTSGIVALDFDTKKWSETGTRPTPLSVGVAEAKSVQIARIVQSLQRLPGLQDDLEQPL